MKKALLTLLIASMAAPVFAQDMTIQKTDGSSETVSMEQLHKLTFPGTDMVVTREDGRQSTYSISTISLLNFIGQTRVQTIKAIEGKLEYDNATAIVTDSKGQTLSVFNLSGKVVLEESIISDYQEIDLSSLTKGMYLLRLGNKTVKIVI